MAGYNEELQAILVRVLDKRMPAPPGSSGRKRISKREALLKTLIQKALEGNSTAVKIVLDFYHLRATSPFWQQQYTSAALAKRARREADRREKADEAS